MRRWLRLLSATFAVAYLVGLALAALLLRLVGERCWATSVALYLPRIAFLAPLPILTGALVAFGPRRLLPTQAIAAVLALFPLMGLVVPSPFSGSRGERPSFRILSFNVDSLAFGSDRVADAIRAERPDVVLLQEFAGGGAFVEALRRSFGAVEVSGQFVVATRFRIRDVTEPERIPYEGRNRSPRFVRYTVETPLGTIALYNVHPISPRLGFYSLRGEGLRKEILTGRLFVAARSGPLQEDTGLRVAQARSISASATQELAPVLIAGDTNLPSLSPTLSECFAGFSDGFRRAGSGFGYTFPAAHPWMRIDRIYSSRHLDVTSFKVGCRDASDHLCVVADVQRSKN